MKKTYLIIGVIVTVICFFSIYWGYNNFIYKDNAIFINVFDDSFMNKANILKTALKKHNRQAIVSKKDSFKSGKFNLYLARDISALPEVIDKTAINILWINSVPGVGLEEKLRQFDVIVVKSVGSFSHLKAINVRTAFIPDAIDYQESKVNDREQRFMYYGDFIPHGDEISILKQLKLDVDVYGNGYNHIWNENKIFSKKPKANDFRKYNLVFIDQTDDDIQNGVVNDKILEVIASGRLPIIRYNSTVEKMFYDVVLMYFGNDNFVSLIQGIRNNPRFIADRYPYLAKLAKEWSSSKQALKFIEIFQIMEQKRI